MNKISHSLISCLLIAPALQAAIVVSDPTYVTGADAIDPTGSMEVGSFNAAGSTSQTTLEGLPGFGAIQSFGGFSGSISTSQEYIFNNTTNLRKDVRLTYTGVTGGGVVAISNTVFATSGLSSMRLSGTATGTYGMNIAFGDWSGTTFSGDATGVSAVGFTLSGRYGLVTSVVVSYFDSLNNLLSSQTMPTTTAVGTATAAAYSGYQTTSGQNGIARVEIVATPVSGETGGLFALDDLGFTAVPEASSSVMMIGGLAALALRRKRRD